MLDVTDVKPTLPAVKNSAPEKGPCLNDLIAIARDAHLAVVSAFTNALDRAIACGRALNQMDKAGLVPHGSWDRVYKRCELGERQALRYKKLARLLEEKPTLKSVLTGLSIEQALKKLAPPKPRAGSKTQPSGRAARQRHPQKQPSPTLWQPGWLRRTPTAREPSMRSGGMPCAAPFHHRGTLS